MKNYVRILALVLCIVLLTLAFASCGKRNKDATATTTAPSTTVPGSENAGSGSTATQKPATTGRDWEPIAKEIRSYAAANKTLKFRLDSFTSPERIAQNDVYLAGPDEVEEGVSSTIAQMVYWRNHNAMNDLGVTVEYSYMDKGWDAQSAEIVTLVQGNAADAPDLFVNMVFDLNIALKTQGVFKDIWHIPGSFFDWSASGWMKDWMESYSFTGDRAYVLAGDYFLDILRAMSVLPFNLTMMDANADKLASAICEPDEPLQAGENLSTRFFDFVEEENWTWEVLGRLCEAIWVDTDGSGADSIGDTLGFVTDRYSGMPAALILFSTGEELTTTSKDETTGQNWIYINEDSTALGRIFDAVKGVVEGSGSFITCDTTSQGATIDQPGIAYHQIKFSEDTLLFCGPQLLGALEGDAFQQMQSTYSVVPLPKVDATKEYNTIVHNTADCGAINVNANPQKTRVVSAYLQHCVENSWDIRDEFLQTVTKYRTTTYNQGTSRMLDLIYDHLTNARDKGIEDAAERRSGERYHGKMKDNEFLWGSADVVSWFESNRATKQGRVDDVLEKWYQLPGGPETAE